MFLQYSKIKQTKGFYFLTQKEYEQIEQYMLSLMKDSAHDRQHIYRVLYVALDIAKSEPTADKDILITACLFHDIDSEKQFKNPSFVFLPLVRFTIQFVCDKLFMGKF